MNPTSSLNRRLAALSELAFPALTVLFGLQLLRVMIPAVVYVYGERPGVSTVDMGVFVLIAFLLAFLAPLLPRVLGAARAVWGSAAGVALLRLAVQLFDAPDVRLWLSPVGVLVFLFFVPIYIGYRRGTPENFALAILAGFAADAALHGAWGTYDYAWQINATSILLAAVLAAAQLLLARRTVAHAGPVAHRDVPFRVALPLVGLGMAIFLHALFLQNVAAQTAMSANSLPAAFLLVMVGNLLGLVVGVVTNGVDSRWQRLALVVVATVLLVVIDTARESTLVGLLAGHAAAAALLVQVGHAAAHAGRLPGLLRTASAWSLAALSFVVLNFLYYASYDLALPFDNALLPRIAGGLLGAAALGAVLASSQAVRRPPEWTPALVGAAMLAFPVATLLATRPPASATGAGWPVRVMSYNIHQGFDVAGWLGMEALAQTIESTGADVVALQEVSRGWYINGSLDTVQWLSRRLGMPFVFAGTADPLWGNAILSRFPVVESGHAPLPQGGVPLRRGFIWARLDLGAGEQVRVVATHVHHAQGEAGPRVRLLQLPVVIEFWGGAGQTVILGDLNSTPDSAEQALFRAAGLLDAFDLAGAGDGYTYAANDPVRRIDYIWLSPDLIASDFEIPPSTASDHLAIAVTVNR